MMAYLPLLTGEGGWNPWVILAYIFIIWANDVFAYLVGVSVGRHHLYERISPNKSWEGFFGGIVGAIAMGCLAAWWLDGSYWLWCCLAAIAAVSGVLGDLIESMFKRAAGVKDSGNILPGARRLARPFRCAHFLVAVRGRLSGIAAYFIRKLTIRI